MLRHSIFHSIFYKPTLTFQFFLTSNPFSEVHKTLGDCSITLCSRWVSLFYFCPNEGIIEFFHYYYCNNCKLLWNLKLIQAAAIKNHCFVSLIAWSYMPSLFFLPKKWPLVISFFKKSRDSAHSSAALALAAA